MSRNEYVALACTMPKSWIEANVADPGSLAPRYVALLRVALRRMVALGGAA